MREWVGQGCKHVARQGGALKQAWVCVMPARTHLPTCCKLVTAASSTRQVILLFPRAFWLDAGDRDTFGYVASPQEQRG